MLCGGGQHGQPQPGEHQRRNRAARAGFPIEKVIGGAVDAAAYPGNRPHAQRAGGPGHVVDRGNPREAPVTCGSIRQQPVSKQPQSERNRGDSRVGGHPAHGLREGVPPGDEEDEKRARDQCDACISREAGECGQRGREVQGARRILLDGPDDIDEGEDRQQDEQRLRPDRARRQRQRYRKADDRGNGYRSPRGTGHAQEPQPGDETDEAVNHGIENAGGEQRIDAEDTRCRKNDREQRRPVGAQARAREGVVSGDQVPGPGDVDDRVGIHTDAEAPSFPRDKQRCGNGQDDDGGPGRTDRGQGGDDAC